MRTPWQLYVAAAEAAPLLTDCANSLCLWLVGDAAAQKIESLNDESKTFNLRRLLYTGLWGMLFIGPFGHFWYLGLELVVGHFLAAGSALFILAKVVLDLGIFGVIHVLGFFMFLTLAEGGSWQDVKGKARTDFWPTYTAECAFWSVFQTGNFLLTPVPYQLLAVNVATVFDSTFLCWARSKSDWASGLKQLLGRAKAALLGGRLGGKGAGDGGAAAAASATAASKCQRVATSSEEAERGELAALHGQPSKKMQLLDRQDTGSGGELGAAPQH